MNPSAGIFEVIEPVVFIEEEDETRLYVVLNEEGKHEITRLKLTGAVDPEAGKVPCQIRVRDGALVCELCAPTRFGVLRQPKGWSPKVVRATPGAVRLLHIWCNNLTEVNNVK